MPDLFYTAANSRSNSPARQGTIRGVRLTKKSFIAFGLIALLAGSSSMTAEESIGDQIKKIFAPTPAPTPRKHRHSSSASKKREDADPSSTPDLHAGKSPSPRPKSEKSSSSSTATGKKGLDSGGSSKKKRKSSPTPSPAESPTPSSSGTATPEENQTTPTSSPSPSTIKKKGAPATIEATAISGYEEYPDKVRKITDMALELTRSNLDYKYGSADPANGGMDCSGFIYYVLTHNEISDVPRDSSQQYVWVRKSATFRAVNSRREDTFELNELLPGDLLFWTGTYNIERDPPITHVMIYLGREKKTNQRIMVGASDGRTYKGESRYGVSVFDFKIPRGGKTDEARTIPSFIGYGRIPGLE